MAAELGLGGYFTKNIDDQKDIITHAYEKGVRFFDTSPVYGSERHFGDALLYYPRESYKLSTKTKAKTSKELNSDLTKSFIYLASPYLDYYFMHSGIDDMETWKASKKVFKEMKKLKQAGLIKKIGASGHSLEAAFEAINSGIDAIMVPHSIMYEKFDSCFKHAKANNVEIITMKNFASGILLGGPEKDNLYSKFVTLGDIIRYSTWVPDVDYIIPAARSIKQFDEIHTAYKDAIFKGSLDAREEDNLKKEISYFLGEDFCRFCNECRPCEVYDWPMSQPGILKAMLYQEKFNLDMKDTYNSYHLNATNCGPCDNLCAKRCPVGINIKGEMIRAHKLFTGEVIQ